MGHIKIKSALDYHDDEGKTSSFKNISLYSSGRSIINNGHQMVLFFLLKTRYTSVHDQVLLPSRFGITVMNRLAIVRILNKELTFHREIKLFKHFYHPRELRD